MLQGFGNEVLFCGDGTNDLIAAGIWKTGYCSVGMESMT